MSERAKPCPRCGNNGKSRDDPVWEGGVCISDEKCADRLVAQRDAWRDLAFMTKALWEAYDYDLHETATQAARTKLTEAQKRVREVCGKENV